MGGALLTCKKSGDAVAPEHDAPQLHGDPQQRQLQERQAQQRRQPAADNRPPRPRNTAGQQQQQRRAQPQKKRRHRARAAGTPLRPVATATIDYTPVAKADRERFKYSCPLCFCYFAETILVTSCCGNYTCYSCSLDHAKQKGGVTAKSTVLPTKLKGVPCPHCNSGGVQFAYVSAKAEVRSYDTSPATKARMDKLGRLSFNSPRPLSPTEESRMEEEADQGGANMTADTPDEFLASSASSMDIARSMGVPESLDQPLPNTVTL